MALLLNVLRLITQFTSHPVVASGKTFVGKFTALGSVRLHVVDTSSINTTADVVNTKSIKSMITTRHIKAARALLAWSQETLAERSGVSIPTIKRLEAEDGALGGRTETSEKIRTTLQAAGIEFTNGDAPGVRLIRLGVAP